MRTFILLVDERRGVPRLVISIAILLTPIAARAADAPSDLLQKAIYAEETVGDLDKAIELYERVVADANTARRAAAQAQYRLGLCYEKQNKADLAKNAFQSVVDDFADQAETVALAEKHLPGKLTLLPAPWKSGEQLQLDMRLPSGLDVGTGVWMVDAGEWDGKKATVCSSRLLVTISGTSGRSQVFCDPETFAPWKSYWNQPPLGVADAVYADDSAAIKIQNKEEPISVKLKGRSFDNEQAAELFRRLPLEEGYKTTLPIVSTLTGQLIELGVDVVAKERCEVPAGTFECYKLALSIGQTFWISADEHRYIVKFAAGGVNAELAKISNRNDGPKQLAEHGVALTIPADWHAYSIPDPRKKLTRRIYLLEPDADVSGELTIGPKEKLSEEERTSPVAWRQAFIAKAKKADATFEVLEPGDTIDANSGGEAAKLVAQSNSDGKPESLYGYAAMNDKIAVTLRFRVPQDKFAAYRATFDEIAASLSLKAD